MTDAELNRAVAERLGGVIVNDSRPLVHTQCGSVNLNERYMLAEGSRKRCDFTTSLDAMAEAEATLTVAERVWYVDTILPYSEDCTGYEGAAAMLSAPARVRAIAFLKATEGRKA